MPEAHHVIGKSQNFPEKIPLFLEKHAGDPAIKVCQTTVHLFYAQYHQDLIPKLKAHLPPRVREILRQEAATSDSDPSSFLHRNTTQSVHGVVDNSQDDMDRNVVFFKNDCMYRHNLAQFNFTTYDVRRGQDVVNLKTSHRDIILLSSRDHSIANTSHPFLYGRVLGIYHVNVIYTGSDMHDFSPRRLEFL